MPPGDSTSAEKCPVDPQTREKWLAAAKAKGQQTLPPHPPAPIDQTDDTKPKERSKQPTKAQQQFLANLQSHTRFSLDSSTWVLTAPPAQQAPPPQHSRPLPTDREISTIPRALDSTYSLNSAERAALPAANSEADTGHDVSSGNWIYPSQAMFFAAMRRKGHAAEAADMQTIVPIHNAVNERAWAEIKTWESRYKTPACEGPRLVSFSGDSKALTPRAWWNGVVGYQRPFDRHDWVVERCGGRRVEYVIDFYEGKKGVEGNEGRLNFYLDVRPKLSNWAGISTRIFNAVGM